MTFDPAAFEDIFLSKKIARFLVFKGCSREEAEELSQRAWLIAWEKREQFRGDCSLLTWVTKIAFNLLQDQWRKPKRTYVDLSALASLGKPPQHDAGIHVQQLLSLMDSDTRRILTERYLKDENRPPKWEVVRAMRQARIRISRRAPLMAAARAAGLGR